MRRSRILAAAAVLIAVVVISFATAGSLEPKTVQEVNGLDRILTVRTVEEGPLLWTDELRNASVWTVANSTIAGGTLAANGALHVTAKFSRSMNYSFIEVQREVNLSLDANPVLCLQIEVSSGLTYGITFRGLLPNGTSFDTLGDSSFLQERTGLGSAENVSANLRYEAFLATSIAPPLGSRIFLMSIYLEVAPAQSGNFSMMITRLAAFGLIGSSRPITGKPITGSFLEVVLGLQSPYNVTTFYQAYLGFDIKGTADLEYAGYVAQGYSILAQSFNYRAKTLIPYEFMLMSPEQELVSGIPPNYLDANSYCIILSAYKGSITDFHLDSLDLRYATFNSSIINASELPFLQAMFLLYVALIFQVPLCTVIVLYEIRKSEE